MWRETTDAYVIFSMQSSMQLSSFFLPLTLTHPHTFFKSFSLTCRIQHCRLKRVHYRKPSLPYIFICCSSSRLSYHLHHEEETSLSAAIQTLHLFILSAPFNFAFFWAGFFLRNTSKNICDFVLFRCQLLFVLCCTQQHAEGELLNVFCADTDLFRHGLHSQQGNMTLWVERVVF